MSKKSRNFLIVFLLIVTNIITFVIGNTIAIKTENKILISQEEYQNLQATYNKQSKGNMLKDYIKENYLREITDEELDEGEYAGIFQAIDDPYSGYLTKEDFKDLSDQTSGTYGGIGVVVSAGEDGFITVVSPILNTPGEKAGLQTGDKIVKVNGKEYSASQMDEAVKNMKGEPNTKVVLSIMKNDAKNNELTDIEIERELIKLETIESNTIDDLGYIRITSFDENTHSDFKNSLKELENKNVKGLIIDLRNNPGGLLKSTVAIADELLDEGTVVYTERKNGDKTYEKSKDGKTELPIVVLVNKGSASASEILSGALQDRERAIIVGETTFGKGVVQVIKQLPDGSGFKLTESEYFTPNGNSVHDKGITPDEIVELPEDIKVIGIENKEKDTQLQKAIELLNK